VAQHQARWPVLVMCEVMQVSRSGFYAYVQRQAPACVGAEEAALLARVKAIAAETRYSYGSRRMAKQLQDDGFAIGRYKARRLMRQANVLVQRPRKRHPVTTDSRHGYMVAPNLLARQFAVEQPDQVWVGDITYVWTAEGWLYLAVLLDLYSRKVVGWAMSHRVDVALVRGGGAPPPPGGSAPPHPRGGVDPPLGSRESICLWRLSIVAGGTRHPL
jgi:putative transposase